MGQDISIGKVVLWFVAAVVDIAAVFLLWSNAANLLNKADDLAVGVGVVLLVAALVLTLASVLFVALKVKKWVDQRELEPRVEARVVAPEKEGE